MVEGVESKGGVLDSDELTTLHLHARQAAVAVYRKLAIGGYQKEFDDELEVAKRGPRRLDPVQRVDVGQSATGGLGTTMPPRGSNM